MATLVIHTQGTLVTAKGRHLVISTPEGLSRDLPIVHLDRVHCYGKVQVTTAAIGLLADAGKDLVWFTRRGRLRARLALNPSHGVALRRAQYALADSPQGRVMAARLIAAKIANQRAVLLRAWRERPERHDQSLLDDLQHTEQDALNTTDPERLMGLEGTCARRFFTAWAAIMPQFPWNGRNRRPPRDPLNVCLSFGYTVLTNEVQAQLESLGFDPWLGVLHQVRAGCPCLALDLVEPWRPLIIDRLILDLISHNRLNDTHFENDIAPDPDEEPHAQTPEDSLTGMRFSAEGLRRFLVAYERRMAHRDRANPIDAETAPEGLRPTLSQSIQDLARALREGTMETWQAPRLRT